MDDSLSLQVYWKHFKGFYPPIRVKNYGVALWLGFCHIGMRHGSAWTQHFNVFCQLSCLFCLQCIKDNFGGRR